MMCPGCRYEPFERVDHAKTASRYQCYTEAHGQGIFQFIRYRQGRAKSKSGTGCQDEIVSHKIFGNLSYVSFQPYHVISPRPSQNSFMASLRNDSIPLLVFVAPVIASTSLVPSAFLSLTTNILGLNFLPINCFLN